MGKGQRTQPPNQWVPGSLSFGVKRSGREGDDSPPSSAEVKEWVGLYLHSPNTPSWRGAQLKHRDNFTFTFLYIQEDLLQSSWTHLITPSRNFVGLRWRSLFLPCNALLTTLHPLLENVLQTVDHFEVSCLGAPFSWLEKPRNRMGRDLDWILCSAWKKWIGRTSLEHPPYSPELSTDEKCIQNFLSENLKGRYYAGDLDTDWG
jgi:hypothetical protein